MVVLSVVVIGANASPLPLGADETGNVGRVESPSIEFLVANSAAILALIHAIIW